MRYCKSAFLTLFVLFAVCLPSLASEVKLPETMVWSCYDVGSTGYVQASAVANAFLKKYNIRVRLIPSGTSIGRMMPLIAKRARVAFLANEAFFSSEGSYDFATYTWGPQDLRAVVGAPTSFPLITTKTSGIKEVADLKGKRVSWVVGNPSLNVKMTAMMAFASLTWDDVQKVEFPSYADSLKALIQGNVDAADGSTTASILYELESSSKGVYYPQLDPNNKEGWARLKKYVPFAFPYQETVGAGVNKEEPLWLLGYRYPIVTVRADEDPEFVSNLIQAIEETFPLYKNAAASMPAWEIKLSGNTPIDVPFHPGAIDYLKKKGLWTEENQAWNDERIDTLQKIKKLWNESVAVSKAQKQSEDEFRLVWMKKLEEFNKDSN
jgi:TRAP transporter TAXI family solute receptor